jgi:hypothetical protein
LEKEKWMNRFQKKFITAGSEKTHCLNLLKNALNPGGNFCLTMKLKNGMKTIMM